MTGPEHYRQAERCLNSATRADDRDRSEYWQRQAQVHATLALVAATASLDASEGPGGGSATGRTAEDAKAWEATLSGGVSE